MAHINFSKEDEALHEVIDKDAGVIKCNGVVIPEPSPSEVFKVMYNIKGGVMKW